MEKTNSAINQDKILRFKNALKKSKKINNKRKFVNTDDITFDVGEQGYE